MAFPNFIRICLLNLLAGSTVSGWNPVSRTQFQSIVDKGDLALVAFMAPSSEGTKALEPAWAAAAARSQQPFISIDCTVEVSLCKENEVVSYPAIRLSRGRDKMTRYRGPRKAPSIVSFMNRSILPQVSILDKANITSFQSVDEVVFIAYLDPEDADTKSTFTTIASRNNDKFAFGIVYGASLAKAENLPFPSIVCYKPQEGEMEILPGKPGKKELQRFLETAAIPLIGEMTRRNEMKYLKSGKSLIYIFALTEDERSDFRARLRPLAKRYKEYLSFVTIDAIEYEPMAQALGLGVGGFPALVVQNPILGQTFLHDQAREITPDSVEALVLDIVQGKAQLNREAKEGGAHKEL